MNPTKLPHLAVSARSLDFVLPYIRRQLPGWEVVAEDGSEADARVALLAYDEEMPADISAGTTVLVCLNTIGTGMTGLPMTLAAGVANGRFFHIEGASPARISTIHASDVAKAVELSLGDGGRYFISDGTDPTVDQLADALAYRLGDKRILTIKPWMAKWLMPASLRRLAAEGSTARCNVFAEKFGFRPTPVTEYLRTHVYDESSL